MAIFEAPVPASQLNKGIHSLVKAFAKIKTITELKLACVHHIVRFLSCICGADKCEKKETAAEKCI